jgi:hypothetical protein
MHMTVRGWPVILALWLLGAGIWKTAELIF